MWYKIIAFDDCGITEFGETQLRYLGIPQLFLGIFVKRKEEKLADKFINWYEELWRE